MDERGVGGAVGREIIIMRSLRGGGMVMLTLPGRGRRAVWLEIVVLWSAGRVGSRSGTAGGAGRVAARVRVGVGVGGLRPSSVVPTGRSSCGRRTRNAHGAREERCLQHFF
jgi:hypothetical protein